MTEQLENTTETEAQDTPATETNIPAQEDVDGDDVDVVLLPEEDDGEQEGKTDKPESEDGSEDNEQEAQEKTATQDSSVIRNLRAQERRLRAERKQLQAENERLKAERQPQATDTAEKEPTKPMKPFDEANPNYGDTELYDRQLEEYYAAKSAYDAKQREKQQREQQERAKVQDEIKAYRDAYDKIAARRSDAIDAEKMAADTLSNEQQAAIFTAAETPAMAAQLIYQLGLGLLNGNKNAEQIVALDGPNIGKFVKRIGQLELQIMNAPKKQPVPAPEKTVKASTAVLSPEAHLAKLEAEAAKTGDRSAIIRYRKQMEKQNK